MHFIGLDHRDTGLPTKDESRRLLDTNRQTVIKVPHFSLKIVTSVTLF